MKRRFGLLAAIGLALLALVETAVAADSAETPEALLARAIDGDSQRSMKAELRMASESQEREFVVRRAFFDGVERLKIDVLAPFNFKGIRYVFTGATAKNAAHFVYLPSLRRTVRISSEHRKQPFLNSEFFVEDLVPLDLAAFELRFLDDVEIDGRRCRRIEARARADRDLLYSKRVIAIDPTRLVILQTEFFDARGKALKTWVVEKFEERSGVWTPIRQRMTPADGSSAWTLEMLEVEYDLAFSESDFNPRPIDG